MLGMVSYAQTMIYKHSTENKRSSNTNPTKMEMVSYAQTMIYKTLHREKRSSNTNLTKAGDAYLLRNFSYQLWIIVIWFNVFEFSANKQP
jgi:hypothetical protein